MTTLVNLGFTVDEARTLRRISMTLRRWYALTCGDDVGCIERDDDTGRPYWHHALTGRRVPIRDRERGAERRLLALMARHAPLTAYLQTDPRGAALYILRPGDVTTAATPSPTTRAGSVCAEKV
jgi:hypothetical protein